MTSTYNDSLGRYCFRVSLGFLSVLLLLWAWQKLYDPHILPIQHVKIIGDFLPSSQLSLQKSVTPFMQNGLLRLDKNALQAHLLQHDWIKSISIYRIWPDTLTIQIRSRAPIARIVAKDKTYLIDNQGFVFQAEDRFNPSHLPLLIGSPEYAKILLEMYQALKALLTPLAYSIYSLELDSEYRWQLELTHGLKLLLGHQDPVGQLKRLLSIYPEILKHQPSKIISIDLRYPKGIAISTHEPLQ